MKGIMKMANSALSDSLPIPNPNDPTSPTVIDTETFVGIQYPDGRIIGFNIWGTTVVDTTKIEIKDSFPVKIKNNWG